MLSLSHDLQLLYPYHMTYSWSLGRLLFVYSFMILWIQMFFTY